jgi:hypothetical protein
LDEKRGLPESKVAGPRDRIVEARLRLDAAALLLANALTVGDIELPDAAIGAVALIEKARLWPGPI